MPTWSTTVQAPASPELLPHPRRERDGIDDTIDELKTARRLLEAVITAASTDADGTSACDPWQPGLATTPHDQGRGNRQKLKDLLTWTGSVPAHPEFQCPGHGAGRLNCSAAVDKYSSPGGGFGTDTAPSDAGYAAVIYAQGQLGIPYLWGGDGPAEGGFDCSGLTRAAYLAAGINLPRTAQTQYEAGPVVPSGEPLQIGDLVFYGTATDIHHVAIYIGNGQIITAPGRGKVVRVASYRWERDDYFGATRPGN